MRFGPMFGAIALALSAPVSATTFIREGTGNVSGAIDLLPYQGSFATAAFTFSNGAPEFSGVYLEAIAYQCAVVGGGCGSSGDDIDFYPVPKIKTIRDGFSYKFLLPNDGYAFGGSFRRIFHTQVLHFNARSADDFSYMLVVTISPGPVPEPATWAMLIAGFGLVGGALRIRTRSTVPA